MGGWQQRPPGLLSLPGGANRVALNAANATPARAGRPGCESSCSSCVQVWASCCSGSFPLSQAAPLAVGESGCCSVHTQSLVCLQGSARVFVSSFLHEHGHELCKRMHTACQQHAFYTQTRAKHGLPSAAWCMPDPEVTTHSVSACLLAHATDEARAFSWGCWELNVWTPELQPKNNPLLSQLTSKAVKPP